MEETGERLLFSHPKHRQVILTTPRVSIGPSPCFKPSDRLLHAANRLEPGGTRALKLNIPSNDHCLSGKSAENEINT